MHRLSYNLCESEGQPEQFNCKLSWVITMQTERESGRQILVIHYMLLFALIVA
jgi:hypothetical protein